MVNAMVKVLNQNRIRRGETVLGFDGAMRGVLCLSLVAILSRVCSGSDDETRASSDVVSSPPLDSGKKTCYIFFRFIHTLDTQLRVFMLLLWRP